jgi:hypothetical protein
MQGAVRFLDHPQTEVVVTGLGVRGLVMNVVVGTQHAVMVFERAGAEVWVSGHGMTGR